MQQALQEAIQSSGRSCITHKRLYLPGNIMHITEEEPSRYSTVLRTLSPFKEGRNGVLHRFQQLRESYKCNNVICSNTCGIVECLFLAFLE